MRAISFSRKPGFGFLRQAVTSTILFGSIGSIAFAKPASLTAIVLYDGPSGAAYLQVGDLLINGKAEVRDCTPFQGGSIDKTTYGKMQKVVLAASLILERDQQGVLRYGPANGSPLCIVPENIKFEHNAAYSLSELADQAKLSGTAIDVAATGLPIIQKGVKLVFVAAPDKELAEFLLAQRAATIPGWQNYLAKYSSSSHVQEAKVSLSLLFVGAGEGYLSAYGKSAATLAPSYADLKNAKAQEEKALAITPSLDQAMKLKAAVLKELNAIADRGQSELQAYKTALQAGVAGYIHLQNAKKLGDALAGIDPGFQPGQDLLKNALLASNAFDSALLNAESAVTGKQMDAAMESIKPLIPFSSEEPRIPAVVNAAYSYYFQLGKQFSAASDWDNAIKNLNKAVKVKDTSEVDEAIKQANKELVIVRDKTAATKAQETSKDYEDKKDYINAFETLYYLPPAQKALVSDDIDRLKDLYVKAATDQAQILQKIHEDLAVTGTADEIGMEQAYQYYVMAYELTQQATYHDSMAVLAEDLSKYFVIKAKTYIDKPEGSGTEIGWQYLDEALAYLPSNQLAHDTKEAARAAHDMHSKISFKVLFRDQTSSRDSSGFIDTLEDAIVTGLEESPTIKAVRAKEQSGTVEPDFELEGEIVEHQITETPTVTAKASVYFVTTRDVDNEKWSTAKRSYDTALREIDADNTNLQAAATKNNKKLMKEISAKLDQDKKTEADAQTVLDSTPPKRTEDVTRPYNYHERTIDVQNTIKLQFRIGETLSTQKGNAEVVEKGDPRQFVLIEDVKPEDTNGVKPTGTSPNTRELQTALENTVRDLLIEKVKARVSRLPQELYSRAKAKEDEEDINGAGEAYLRYLSATSEDGSAERKHAKGFLKSNFNMDLDAEAKR
jgi:tetratricopeptide (TPR) repeat protein